MRTDARNLMTVSKQ